MAVIGGYPSFNHTNYTPVDSGAPHQPHGGATAHADPEGREPNGLQDKDTKAFVDRCDQNALEQEQKLLTHGGKNPGHPSDDRVYQALTEQAVQRNQLTNVKQRHEMPPQPEGIQPHFIPV
jgi:hypothetical protein